jgi:hypothetical protein
MQEIFSIFVYIFTEHIEFEIHTLSDFYDSEIGPVLCKWYERYTEFSWCIIDHGETHAVDRDTPLPDDEMSIYLRVGNTENQRSIFSFFSEYDFSYCIDMSTHYVSIDTISDF